MSALPFIGTVLVAIIGFAASWAATRDGRRARQERRSDHDRAEVLDAWRDLVDPLRAELGRCSERIDALTQRVDRLSAWRDRATSYIRRLVSMLHDAGLEPPEPPHGLDLDDDLPRWRFPDD